MYWCHSCNSSFTLPPHRHTDDSQLIITCPICSSEFVEETEAPEHYPDPLSMMMGPDHHLFSQLAGFNLGQRQRTFSSSTSGPSHTHVTMQFGGGQQMEMNLPNILQQLFEISTGAMSNSGDYAWGPGGLDDIITRMMEQTRGSTHTPATEEQLDNLESVQVESGNECTICKDDVEGECVRLKCRHIFHRECIVSWLRINATCPICRSDMNQE